MQGKIAMLNKKLGVESNPYKIPATATGRALNLQVKFSFSAQLQGTQCEFYQ